MTRRADRSENFAPAIESDVQEEGIVMRSSARGLAVLVSTVLGAAAMCDARADEEPSVQEVGIADTVAAISPTDAPRLTRTDTSADAQPSAAGYRNEVTELSYRWWASSGRVDWGLGLGTLAYVARPNGSVPGLVGDGAVRSLANGTVFTMGLRVRTSDRSVVYADAAGVRGLGLDTGDAVVGRVGLEFKAAQSRWNVNYGGLGLRLAGDTRMTLRVRRGGLSVYMRSSF